jgi:transcriptional regulator GlxA family with amidase domain
MDGNAKLNLGRRSMIVGGTIAAAGLVAGLVKAREVNASAAAAAAQVQQLAGTAGASPVAFLMDDGITMIDFAGPWEVFQDAGFPIFTVASTQAELQTTGSMEGARMNGLKFHADYTFDNAPQPKVVVIGAQANGTNPAKLEWLRHVVAGADVLMSVCTGAFVLANTGLLDGLSATTHHNSYDRFAERFPKVHLVRGTRFVDNGKLITAGGLTSGIDTALHVVNRYSGQANTRQVARYMEYQGTAWLA